MGRYDMYINSYRYILLLGAVLATLMKIPPAEYASYTMVVLLLIINTQARTLFRRNKIIILSLLADIPVVIYLDSRYQGFIYLALIVTLIDAMLKLRAEIYTLFIIITMAFIYTLQKLGTTDMIIVSGIFYLAAFLFLLHLRRELLARTDVETLYDQIRKNNYELEAARARLLEYSKQVEKMTALEERNRISRQLHDSIGHSLTGILMQVDAAIQILDVDKEKGMEVLRSAHANINNSIETVRQTVRKLHPIEYKTHTASLQEMIEKFKKSTGVNVETKVTGTSCELFPSVETVLYSNVQEALTNAVRHGHARNILIHTIYKNSCVEVIISDDGTGSKNIKKGFGLSGMEERMEVIGGSISYSSVDGFTVHMLMPV